MPSHRQEAKQKFHLRSQPAQEIHLSLREKPALSIWQSAVLAYASAKCGKTFTSIEQTDKWLRTNLKNPQHLTVKAVRGLLVAEPPRENPEIPPTAA